MSLFGASASQPASGTPATNPFSSFGASTSAAAPGLFGASQSQTQQTGGLFGASQPQRPTLFGGFANSATPTTPAQQPSAGLFGGFGGTPAQPAASGGGLFGGAQPASTASFGTNAGQTASASGSLFGSVPSQPASSGGLFGAASGQSAPGGGVFGSSNNTAQSPAGGLFGSTPQTQPQQPSLFGASTGQQQQGTPAPSLFVAQPQQPAQSLFGTPSPAQAPQPSTSLFGSFGQPQQQQQTALGTSTGLNLFASSTTPAAPSQWGAIAPGNSAAPSTSLSSMFPAKPGSGPFAAQQPSAEQIQQQFAGLSKQIEEVLRAWLPQSADCAFQHFFYNLVDPNQVATYRRPDNWTNAALWERAVKDNPDPSCLVPVLAVGFDDLQRRELSSRLEALSQKHILSNSIRMQRAAVLQAQLSHRVIHIVQHLHLLIPSVRSSAIRPEEEALRTALEAIEEELKKPGGMGRMRGKLNELWALVGAVNAAKERDRRARPDSNVEWAVVDDDGLQRITHILKEQQHGLAHVTKILRDSMTDLAIMEAGGTTTTLPTSMSSSTVSQSASGAAQMLLRQ